MSATLAGSLRRRLVRGSAWVFAGKLVGSVLGLAVNAILARLLSDEALGTYFIAFSTAMFASTLADLGLDRAIVRFISASLATGHPERARAVIRVSFALAAGGALLSAAVLVVAVGPLLTGWLGGSSATGTVVVLVGAWTIGLAYQTLVAETFRGFHEFRLATLFDGVATNVFTVAVLGVLLIVDGRLGLGEAVGVSVACVAASLAVAAIPLVRRTARIPAGGAIDRKELLAVAWPLLVVNAAVFLLGTGIDIWIVGAIAGTSDAALYGAAARLVLFVATPLVIVLQVVPPIVAELHAQNRPRELERALRTVATVAGIPATCVLAVFLFAGRPVLEAVYGDFYGAAAVVLAVLSCGRLFAVYTGTCGVALMMTGNQRTMMTITLISGAWSVGWGVLLGLEFGMVGVAAGTVSGQVIQNAAQLVFARRRLGIWTHARLSAEPLRELLAMRRRG